MAKLSSIQKNIFRSQLVNKYKNKRRDLKAKIMKKDISIEERLKLQSKLNDLPRNSSSIRYRNRCKLTGRPKGYMRNFGISRVLFREMANKGLIPGVKKASW